MGSSAIFDHEIRMNDLQNGVYFLNIEYNGSVYSRKIVKH